MPEEVEFRTKPQIAMALVDRALGHGVRVRPGHSTKAMVATRRFWMACKSVARSS